jgi:hypothetical protein
MCDAFRIEGVISLLVEFTAPGIYSVDDGLVGPEVNCILASFVSNAGSGISLDLRSFGIYPCMDPIVKGVRGHGDGLCGKFLGRVSDNIDNVVDQEAPLSHPPFVDVAVDVQQDLVKEGFPEGPGVDCIGELEGFGEYGGVLGLSGVT